MAFNFIDIEYATTESTVASVLDMRLTHMPYSHSVVSTLILFAVAWLVISKWLKRPTIAFAVSMVIASHLALDLLTHNQDIAVAPFLAWEKIGLSLYAVPLLVFFVETINGTACWWIYKGSKSLLLTILVFNLANLSFFSTAIIGPEALLANRPLVLTGVVFIQIVLILILVGLLCRGGGPYFDTGWSPC